MDFLQEMQESLKEKNTEEEKQEEAHNSQKDNFLSFFSFLYLL